MRASRRAAVVVGALAAFGLGGAGIATAAEAAAVPGVPALTDGGLPDPTSVIPVVQEQVYNLLLPLGIV